jgi:hypothetical protein
LRHDKIFRERTIDRRCSEKPYVGAQVVTASPALLTLPAGHARLDTHALAGAVLGDFLANRDYGARRLVAEHQRIAHNERADPTMFEIVHVGAAYPNRADPYEQLSWSWPWYGSLFDADVAEAVENRSALG